LKTLSTRGTFDWKNAHVDNFFKMYN
jgi:hypothetical protein